MKEDCICDSGLTPENKKFFSDQRAALEKRMQAAMEAGDKLAAEIVVTELKLLNIREIFQAKPPEDQQTRQTFEAAIRELERRIQYLRNIANPPKAETFLDSTEKGEAAKKTSSPQQKTFAPTGKAGRTGGDGKKGITQKRTSKECCGKAGKPGR